MKRLPETEAFFHIQPTLPLQLTLNMRVMLVQILHLISYASAIIALYRFVKVQYSVLGGIRMTLKELRTSRGLTQKQVSELSGMPLRTYKNYENDSGKRNSIKYRYLIDTIEAATLIDESHGILSIDQIKAACADVFKDYDIEVCVLFGSYASGTATETSDVDLLVITRTTGMKFYGIVERLRQSLHKNVDVLDFNQLSNNLDLTAEIMKKGIRIYDKS